MGKYTSHLFPLSFSAQTNVFVTFNSSVISLSFVPGVQYTEGATTTNTLVKTFFPFPSLSNEKTENHFRGRTEKEPRKKCGSGQEFPLGLKVDEMASSQRRAEWGTVSEQGGR